MCRRTLNSLNKMPSRPIFTTALIFLLVLFCSAFAQEETREETRLIPRVLENPPDTVIAKYRFSITGRYRDSGVLIETVNEDSPLLRMRSGASDSTFRIEPGDHILGVMGGNGVFYIPNSPRRFAAITNSLSEPKTELIVRDKRTNKSFRYQVALLKGQAEAPANAPPEAIKVLLIGDTDDTSIGTSVKGELDAISKLIEVSIPEEQRGKIERVEGKDFSKNAILGFVKAWKVDKTREGIFCWVSCHGAHKPHLLNDPSGGHFFERRDGDFLLRSTLFDALKNKSDRLTILLSNSCNAPVPAEEATKLRPSGALKRLLLWHSGFVDINSASPKQLALGDLFGDAFQACCLAKDSEDQWEAFFKKWQGQTSQDYKNVRKKILSNPPPPNDSYYQTYLYLKEQDDQRPHAYKLNVRRFYPDPFKPGKVPNAATPRFPGTWPRASTTRTPPAGTAYGRADLLTGVMMHDLGQVLNYRDIIPAVNDD
jgi:hypothetical protein